MPQRKRHVHFGDHRLFDARLKLQREHGDDGVQWDADAVATGLLWPLRRRRNRRGAWWSLVRGIDTHCAGLLVHRGVWRRITIPVGVAFRRAGPKQVFEKLKHHFWNRPKAFSGPLSRRFKCQRVQDLCQQLHAGITCIEICALNHSLAYWPLSPQRIQSVLCPIRGLGCPVPPLFLSSDDTTKARWRRRFG